MSTPIKSWEQIREEFLKSCKENEFFVGFGVADGGDGYMEDYNIYLDPEDGKKIADFFISRAKEREAGLAEEIEKRILDLSMQPTIKEAIEWAREQVSYDTSHAIEGAELSGLYQILSLLTSTKE